VVVAGATARLAPESAAQVRNDPRNDQHEILVKAGSGEVVRGNETVSLASYEKVSFSSDSAKMAKSKEIAPPTLIAPANMMPMFVGGAAGPVEFSWTPIEGAKGYHLRVSKNPYFSSTVYDRRVQTSSVKLPALGEGAYYWVVQTVDASGKISAESEKNRFTVIKRGATEVQHPARSRDRGPREDRAQRARHGEWTGSAGNHQRGPVSLLHAAVTHRGKRDHHHRAEYQGRREHDDQESGDPVKFFRSSYMGQGIGALEVYPDRQEVRKVESRVPICR
jgi:hypothetical protein